MSRTFIFHTPLDGSPEQLNFVSAQGHEALSMVSDIRIECVAEVPYIDARKLLGKSLTIEISTQNPDSPRYLNGLATGFAHLGPDNNADNQYRYRITLSSWLSLADVKTDCRVFLRKDIPTIISETLEDMGMPFEMRTVQVYPVREYCVQFQETRLNFVMRLAESVGIYFYTRHELGQHTIVFCDGMHPTLDGIYSELEFRTPGKTSGAGSEDKEYVLDWMVEHQLRPGRYVVNTYNFKNPRAALLKKNENRNDHTQDGIEVYEWTGAYTEHDEGEKLAEVRQGQEQHDFRTITVASNVRAMAPGYLFTLSEHPDSEANDKYLIVNATYHFREAPYTSRSNGQGTDWRIDCTVRSSRDRYYHPQTAKKVKVEGVHTAVVCGPAGKEIWCDKYGRVIVQFMWDRYGKFDENSSCWIRVSSPWAGSNFGAICIPRIKQEVLIEYINGDIDLPVLVGRVHHEFQMPPWDLPANATQTGFLTRSTPDGRYHHANALRFEDKKGAEQLWIQAERNMDTHVEANDTQTVGADRTITVDGTHTETIKKDTTIKITEGDHSTTVIQGNQSNTVTTGNQKNIVSTGTQTNLVAGDIEVGTQANYILSAKESIVFVVGASTITMTPGNITLDSPQIDLNPSKK